MPGLAPINVYQNNAVGVKTATIPNVLLQLKDGEYTTNSEILPTTLLKRSVSAKEDRAHDLHRPPHRTPAAHPPKVVQVRLRNKGD